MGKKAARKIVKTAKKPVTSVRRRFGPAQRLLETQKLLKTAHGATFDEIARRLDSSKDTAIRAVRALEQMGEPVREERDGRILRFRIVVGAKETKGKPLSTPHVLAVALAQKSLDYLGGTTLKEAFDQVVQKLESELAPKAFEALERLRKKVVVSPDGQWVKTDRTEIMSEILTALTKGERVTVRGPGTGGKDREFLFEPYSIVVWNYGLYVAGYSHHHNQVRLFGIDKLTAGDWHDGEGFEIPDSWDAEELYGDALGLFEGPKMTVRVRFDATMARYAARKLWSKGQSVEEHEGGEVIVTMTGRGALDIINKLLPFREHAEVLEPPSLRAEMAKTVQRMAAVYAKQS